MSRKNLVIGSVIAIVAIAGAGVAIFGTNKKSPATTSAHLPVQPEGAKSQVQAAAPKSRPSFLEQAMQPLPSAPNLPHSVPARPVQPPASVAGDMQAAARPATVVSAPPVTQSTQTVQTPASLPSAGPSTAPSILKPAQSGTVTAPMPVARPVTAPPPQRTIAAAQVGTAPAAPPPQPRQQTAETVTVTAQRQTQVARVDVDAIGRGNSLTIQLPKRK